nr:PREDICTED: sperm acrosome membrane-associated protein 4-like isoform X1 [Latimeria chalumnae]|eukprot:XP_006013544.1 PREDICTED: sperm acrosome membrane-associated protein 4-like isoform X1 [Latimeria chalumnae]
MVKLPLLVRVALVLMLCPPLGTSLQCYDCDETKLDTKTCEKTICLTNLNCGKFTGQVDKKPVVNFQKCFEEKECNKKINTTISDHFYNGSTTCCKTDLCNQGLVATFSVVAFLLPLSLCMELLL